MNWINIVSGPVLGAVIGYFTNYIAVKMLFRPYRPVRLGRWTLPFTPGVIPRRKGDLARAIGGAIENNLLRRDDILDVLASEDMRSAVANGIWSQVEPPTTRVEALSPRRLAASAHTGATGAPGWTILGSLFRSIPRLAISAGQRRSMRS